MNLDPDKHYPSARAVAATLTGFVLWLPVTNITVSRPATTSDKSHLRRVLLVDDDNADSAIDVANPEG